MADRDLERLILRIAGDASELKRSLKTTEADVRSSAGQMERAFGGVTRGVKSIAAALVPLSAIGGAGFLVSLAKDAVDAADELQDVADRIGIGTEALQELRFAASQFGVEAGKLDGALEKLAKSQSEAASGEKEQADAFRALGVAVKDANGNLIPLEELVPRVADGLANLASQQDRVRIAADLFGRGAGADLVNVLQNGSAALDEMAARARQLGIVIDRDTIQQTADLADQISALNEAAGAQLREALVALAPLLYDIAKAAAEAAREFSDFVNSAKSLENQSIGLIERQIKAEKALIDSIKQSGPDFDRFVLAQHEERLRALQLELEAKRDERDDAEAQTQAARQRQVDTGRIVPKTVGAGGGGKTAEEKAAEKLARDREAFLEALNRDLATASGSRLATLDFERDESLKKAREIFQNQEELERVERDINAVYDERVDTLFDQMVQGYEKATDKATDLQDAGQEALDKLREGAEEFGASLSRAFADAAFNGELTWKGLGESFLRDFVAKIIQGGLQLGSTALFGSGKSGDTGILGDLIGSAGGSVLSAVFGGFRAGGGPVAPGKAYVVGERGREWYVPDAPGRIVPASPGAAGSSGITVEMPVSIENYAPVPVKVQQRRRANGSTEIRAIIGEVFQQDMASHGPMSRAVAQRFRLQPAGS